MAYTLVYCPFQRGYRLVPVAPAPAPDRVIVAARLPDYFHPLPWDQTRPLYRT
jgi:hypothetical protein